MIVSHRQCLILLYVLISWQGALNAHAEDIDEAGTITVLVGFRSRKEQQEFTEESAANLSYLARSSSNAKPAKAVHPFQQTNAVAMKVTKQEYEEMKADSRFAYVQEDSQTFKLSFPSSRYLQDGVEVEEKGYGLFSVQGDQDGIPMPPSSAPTCLINVCIVDSGLIEDHYDIPYERGSAYLDGEGFGLPSGQYWWNPLLDDDHGTAVAGIMIAKGNNGRGTVGIIPYGPEDSKVCLNIARVFEDGADSTATSNILKAVEWCGEQQAAADPASHMVVNLSLGSTAQTATEKQIYSELYQQGILFAAAAGNEGNEQYAFPASLTEVISVASVGETEEHSRFSNVNDRVELAAPGGKVLASSGDGLFGKRLDLSIAGRKVQSFFMADNDYPFNFNFGQQFEMVDCGYGYDVCPNAQGKVCLMERDGAYSFRKKASNCQRGGGIMALIFNNEGGTFNGRINDDNVNIPCLAMNQKNGQYARNNVGQPFTANNVYGNIGYFSGTSFSTPHVVGVAAKIWAARPECTNKQIRLALQQSARPLETPIPNSYTGYGMVQAVDAYNYILANFPSPCGAQGETNNTPDPSPPPTPSPTPRPTPAPTFPPTPRPTPRPTPSPTEGCAGDMKACISDDDCCSDHTCRRVSADPSVPFVCRLILNDQSKGDFKLARNSGGDPTYCAGGQGCRRKRLLRGEPSSAIAETAMELEAEEDAEKDEAVATKFRNDTIAGVESLLLPEA
eukprot:scaffold3821_cov127-Cylindrotheca_fusiformis.AAC.1